MIPRFYFSIILLMAFAFNMLFTSCKKRNEEYPPRIWSEYSYNSSTIASRTISSLFYESNHSFWLGSKGNEGLLHHDGYRWNIYNTENTGIPFDSVTCFARDGNGKLWIGWKKGLAAFDGNSWEKIAAFDGLQITSIAVEGIGNILIGIKGNSGGLTVLRNDIWQFFTSTNSEIPSAQINSIISDHNQFVWFATSDKGIIRFKNNQWESLTTSIPLFSQDFTCITEAPDGSIWAGSTSSQLLHFYDNTFTLFNTGTSKPITSLYVSPDGTVWCGTTGAGLIKFNGNDWSSITVENSALPSNDILSITHLETGYLVFSIPGGKLIMIKQ